MTKSIERYKTLASLARASVSHPSAAIVIVRVWRSGLSMLGLRALLELYEAVAWADHRAVPGIILEAGSARGGSGVVLAAARRRARPVYLYDTFAGIPPPGDMDGQQAMSRFQDIQAGRASGVRKQAYYGYESNLIESVRRSFAAYSLPVERSQVHLVPGLYQDTLHPPDRVALAHLDCDWYESVKVCLERIVPCLAQGGRIVVDDYDYWAGCRRAVDEFFAGRMNEFEFIKRRRLHVIYRPTSDAVPHH